MISAFEQRNSGSEHLVEDDNHGHREARVSRRPHHKPVHVVAEFHPADGFFPPDLRHRPPMLVVHRAAPMGVRPFHLVAGAAAAAAGAPPAGRYVSECGLGVTLLDGVNGVEGALAVVYLPLLTKTQLLVSNPRGGVSLDQSNDSNSLEFCQKRYYNLIK